MKIKTAVLYQHVDNMELYKVLDYAKSLQTEYDVFVDSIIYKNYKTGELFVCPIDVFEKQFVEVRESAPTKGADEEL